MTTRFPSIEKPLGLGVGLDMQWGKPFGFLADEASGTGAASPRIEKFLEFYQGDFSYLFFSFQPKSRNRARTEDYLPAYRSMLERLPRSWPIGLHQTTLNLGSVDAYPRDAIIDFTNELIGELGIGWVNEDLGIWSIAGKSLPYPLPPFLNLTGLKASITNVAYYQKRLASPLVVEFPGFTEGSCFHVGRMHAYDFFRKVVEETGSPCTIDTGHLISYQWLRGLRGEELYEELDRLPLASCYEIHLSGCQVVQDRFMDFHHGVLMDEQIEILEELLPLCPNLKAITFEDPKMDENGVLIPKSRANYQKLKETVARWKP